MFSAHPMREAPPTFVKDQDRSFAAPACQDRIFPYDLIPAFGEVLLALCLLYHGRESGEVAAKSRRVGLKSECE
jgi:hypothetical protein